MTWKLRLRLYILMCIASLQGPAAGLQHGPRQPGGPAGGGPPPQGGFLGPSTVTTQKQQWTQHQQLTPCQLAAEALCSVTVCNCDFMCYANPKQCCPLTVPPCMGACAVSAKRACDLPFIWRTACARCLDPGALHAPSTYILVMFHRRSRRRWGASASARST